MDLGLTGKTAVITGGSGGIGRAICRSLAAHGAEVTVHYRDAEDDPLDRDEALELVAALERDGLEATAIGADLSTASGCETLIEASSEALGTATILVNSAGIQPVAAFDQVSTADLASMLATNLQGPFRLMQLFAEQVIAAGIRDASIVNIASISGLRASTLRVAYGTSKAAVIQLTKQQAVELGETGVRVNCICPGPIHTGMTAALPDEAKQKFARRRVPLRRYGDPEEVAQMTLSLCLPASSFVNGEIGRAHV